MSDTKTTGVMAALKGRDGLGSKKGGALLGLVQKLTKKRKEAGESPAEEKSETAAQEKSEK